MKYKTVDLCAGIGGIRRGFELTGGFENVLSAENDPNACLTYALNFGENPENDITTDKFKNIIATVEYDVLMAGFPCQAFSRAGKQAGFEDETKGTIFFHIEEIIRNTRPKAFFLENVDNLVNHDKGRTIKTILRVLVDDLGYKVIGVSKNNDGDLCYSRSTLVRNSKNFGVPQNRPRTYIMGFSRDAFGDLVDSLPDELPNDSGKVLYEDLNDLLEVGAEPRYYMAQGYLDTLVRHKERNSNNGNGFGYEIVNDPSVEHPIAHTIMATGGSGRERNLVYDPQPEIYGMPIPGKKTPVNDRGIRVMTPEEWGKLQGFIGYAFLDEDGDETFEFPDEILDAQRYKQFGNSVTIPVIEAMAKFMLECLKFLSGEA